MEIYIRKPLCFSEIGRKDNQEDYLWPLDSTTEQRIFIMCDGVGGQDSGEVASQTAATALGEWLTANWPKEGIITKEIFEAALSHAYDALDAVDTDGSESMRKMGTTMTCAVLHNGGVLVAHIGDSRIYHVRPSLAVEGRNGIIYQSCDHSLVNDLLRAGELTEEEARDFPSKNIITRAMQPHLERRCKADIYNFTDIKADDYFFLCCDGILERLTNDDLGRILATEATDAEKLAAIKTICDEGTRDNYTCWLVPIDSVGGAVPADDDDKVDEIEAIVDESEAETPVPVTANTPTLTPTFPSHEKRGRLFSVFLPLLVLVAIITLGVWMVHDHLFPLGNQVDTVKTVPQKKENVKRGTMTASPVAPVKSQMEPAKTAVQKVSVDETKEVKEEPKVEETSNTESIDGSHEIGPSSQKTGAKKKEIKKFNKTSANDGLSNR